MWRVEGQYLRPLLDEGADLPYVLDPRYSLDIDTPEQWKFAEWLLECGDPPAVRPAEAETRAVTVAPEPAAKAPSRWRTGPSVKV